MKLTQLSEIENTMLGLLTDNIFNLTCKVILTSSRTSKVGSMNLERRLTCVSASEAEMRTTEVPMPTVCWMEVEKVSCEKTGAAELRSTLMVSVAWPLSAGLPKSDATTFTWTSRSALVSQYQG